MTDRVVVRDGGASNAPVRVVINDRSGATRVERVRPDITVERDVEDDE